MSRRKRLFPGLRERKREPLFPILRARKTRQPQIPAKFRKMPKEVEEALKALAEGSPSPEVRGMRGPSRRTRVAAE